MLADTVIHASTGISHYVYLASVEMELQPLSTALLQADPLCHKLQETQYHQCGSDGLASDSTDPRPAAPMSKPTFLIIPLELRQEIYKHLPSGPLALCCPKPGRYLDTPDTQQVPSMRLFPRPKPSSYLHMPDNQAVSSLGIVRVCHQIRDEAIPVLYERVYLGSNSILHKSVHLFRLDRLILSSAREASIDIPDNTMMLNYWLTYVSPFRKLKHCKLFLQREKGQLTLAEKKATILRDNLIDLKRDSLSSKSPIPSLELKVTLSIRLIRSSDDPPPCDSVEGMLMPSPLQHHEVRQSETLSCIPSDLCRVSNSMLSLKSKERVGKSF